MKKISKKLLSFLLAFGMILSMFVVTSTTSWAADEHVPASATLVAYPKPATESLASLSSKVSGLKSSNKAVVTVKLSKFTYGTSQTYYTILAVPKKAGTATVSFKCQGKTYKIKVTVKKYVNPVKSVKIGATTVSGSKFKSSSETSLSYAKFAGKKVKTTVTLAKGWKLSERYIYSGNDPENGSMKPAIEYMQKGWRSSESVANGRKIPVAGGKGFRIIFTAVNSNTGIRQYMTIMLK